MAATLDGYKTFDLAEFWQELDADERRAYVRDHVEMIRAYARRKRDEAALFATVRTEPKQDEPTLPEGEPVPLPPLPPQGKHLANIYTVMVKHGGFIGLKEIKDATGTPDNSARSSMQWLLRNGVIEEGPQMERNAGLGGRVYKYQSYVVCRE